VAEGLVLGRMFVILATTKSIIQAAATAFNCRHNRFLVIAAGFVLSFYGNARSVFNWQQRLSACLKF